MLLLLARSFLLVNPFFLLAHHSIKTQGGLRPVCPIILAVLVMSSLFWKCDRL